MKIHLLLVHPGTQHSHRLARQLVQLDYLSEFWTGFAIAQNAWYLRMLLPFLSSAWHKKISNRIINGVPAKYLHTRPGVEWQALQRLKRGENAEQIFLERNRSFQEQIPDSSLQQSDGVIGFDTASWLLAERTRHLDKVFFLDQSIAHPTMRETALAKVVQQYPNWGNDIVTRSPELFAYEQQEYALATKIIVASSYTRHSMLLQGIPEHKIVVNPYGVDLNHFQPTSAHLKNRPLRFLFLGSISARKGVPLLLDAWQQLSLKDCELWLVGPINPTIKSLIPDLPGLRVMGSYPHDSLPTLLQQCDVLVFPSYFEGFALVLLEALASGLPIIATEATAGPDLIQNGKEGFIVPSGDRNALCQAIQFFVNHPERLAEMSKLARRCAEQYSWDSYGERWAKIIEENV